MAKRDWIANRSTWTYHIVKRNLDGSYQTICGKIYGGVTEDRLPGGAKSCETCMRLASWEDERTGETT